MQEAAFEASRQLAAQIGAAQHALAELQQLADSLDAQGQGRAEDTARWSATVESNGGKAARYAAQQAVRQAALDRAGFVPEASADEQGMGMRRLHWLAAQRCNVGM